MDDVDLGERNGKTPEDSQYDRELKMMIQMGDAQAGLTGRSRMFAAGDWQKMLRVHGEKDAVRSKVAMPGRTARMSRINNPSLSMREGEWQWVLPERAVMSQSESSATSMVEAES